MNEEYRFVMVNDTRDLVPLPKGIKFVICKCSTKLSMH